MMSLTRREFETVSNALLDALADKTQHDQRAPRILPSPTASDRPAARPPVY